MIRRVQVGIAQHNVHILQQLSRQFQFKSFPFQVSGLYVVTGIVSGFVQRGIRKVVVFDVKISSAETKAVIKPFAFESGFELPLPRRANGRYFIFEQVARSPKRCCGGVRRENIEIVKRRYDNSEQRVPNIAARGRNRVVAHPAYLTVPQSERYFQVAVERHYFL